MVTLIRNRSRFLEARTLLVTLEHAQESPARTHYAVLKPAPRRHPDRLAPAVRIIAPTWFERIARYEHTFGCTIQRGRSIRAMALPGRPRSIWPRTTCATSRLARTRLDLGLASTSQRVWRRDQSLLIPNSPNTEGLGVI